MLASRTLEERIKRLYEKYGQRKKMGIKNTQKSKRPYFFLIRSFLGEQDLLVIFYTKKCRFKCTFCSLTSVSCDLPVSGLEILRQFEYVAYEVKHALSILDRITLSNNGSVLDNITMPSATLTKIASCIEEIRRVRTLVLETRLEFVNRRIITGVQNADSRLKINILTGFETKNEYIREKILGKHMSLQEFELGLDKVADCQAGLTAFVMYKPSPYMTDSEALEEANDSVDYLAQKCEQKGIGLTVRLEPMYASKDTQWTKLAYSLPSYKPPRLTDVIQLAEKKANEGIRMYIDLSTEDFDLKKGSYKFREDYSQDLLKHAILFNNRKMR